MISVVILYPQSDDTTFDMDYYTSKHMPLLAEAIRRISDEASVSSLFD